MLLNGRWNNDRVSPSQLPFPRDKREDIGHHTYAPPATSHVPRDRAPCTPPPIHPLSSKQRVMRADDSPLRGPGITSRSPTSITYQDGIAGLHLSGSSNPVYFRKRQKFALPRGPPRALPPNRPSLGPGRPGHPHPRVPPFVPGLPPHSPHTNREG